MYIVVLIKNSHKNVYAYIYLDINWQLIYWPNKNANISDWDKYFSKNQMYLNVQIYVLTIYSIVLVCITYISLVGVMIGLAKKMFGTIIFLKEWLDFPG